MVASGPWFAKTGIAAFDLFHLCARMPSVGGTAPKYPPFTFALSRGSDAEVRAEFPRVDCAATRLPEPT